MANDPKDVGEPDDSLVYGREDYLYAFADKFGISPNQARDLIKIHGHDRYTLEQEARKLKPRK